ncbi:hypothetical protein HOD29_07150 [archaeon]|jgi:hypothetical protein|nr:hypothetical protein [archaeon]
MGEFIISEEDWEVVENRLESMPESLQLGILGESYSKGDLVVEVKNRSEVGKAYAQMQLEFIKWIAKQSNVI